MKRYISLVLALLLVVFTLCGCETNPNRATCTVSATNGFTGVYCAFENHSDGSSTRYAVNHPLTIEFNEPGIVTYTFTCPACECLIEGNIVTPDSYFFRCDCEDAPQAFVIRATFSADYVPETQPKYEKEP